MNWLEIIELRIGGHPRSDLLRILTLLAQDLNDDPDRLKVQIYKNYDLESDYSIHLLHRQSEPSSMGSALGMHLEQYLEAFGLINRQTWYTITKHVNKKTSTENENLDHRGGTPG